MNALSDLFLHVTDGQTVTLEKDAVYHVRPEDGFVLTGYYCSNTASRRENPDGRRYAAIYLQNKRNVTIDGNGATILIHGKMTPFVWDACEGVTMRDLTVDYARPTMTEFTVLSNDSGVCVLRVRPDCRFRTDGKRLIWQGEDGADGKPCWEHAANADRQHVKVYDPDRDRLYDFDRGQMTFDRIETLDEHTLRVTLHCRDAAFTPGCTFQTRSIVRDQTGALFQRCRDLTLERLRIRFMHGLGMVSQFCENVTFRDCDFTPAAGRTAASTADFFQFSGCRGQLTIERCKACGAHDDHVNVHGTHLRVIRRNRRKHTVVVRFMHPETWGMQAFAVGDRIEWIRYDTLRPYGEAVVNAFERLNDTDVRLTLDRLLPPDMLVGKDAVENATWTPDLLVRDCDFGVTWGRGILCTTRGEVVIENNRFYHTAGPALLVEDDCNFWFESGYTRHVVFRDNTVIGCGGAHAYNGGFPVVRYSPQVLDADSTAFVHGRLTMTGNTFREANAGEHTVRLEYLAEAELSGNVSDAPLRVSAYRCGTIRQTP